MEKIVLHQVDKKILEKQLFYIEKLHLLATDRVGLVGENGVGKSTLLQLIMGLDTDFKGTIFVTPSVGYIPQLKKLSFQSGGEQIKNLLNEVFRQKPDLLILDEPTANLDSWNREWLIKQLQRFRGAILVVSHDRYFLDHIVHNIWFLEDETIQVYHGNYSVAMAERARARQAQYEAYQNHQLKVQQLQEALLLKKEKARRLTKKKKSVSSSDWKVNSRLGSYDGKARRLAQGAKALEKRLAQMAPVMKPRRDSWSKLRPLGEGNGDVHTLFRLSEGCVVIAGRTLFDYPELSVKHGDRVVLGGNNQTGKTTFLRQLINRELEGYYAQKLLISYFSQNLDNLSKDLTAVENIMLTSSQSRETIQNALAMFAIRYDKAGRKVATLSGGERVRVQLVKCLLADSNLLILDEPTNFLDVIAIEALEEGLKQYQGTIIVASHDRQFVDSIAEKNWQINEGKLVINPISERL